MAQFFKRSAAPAGAAAKASSKVTPTSDSSTQSPRKAAFDAIKPDPDKIGISGSVPFVRLPDPGALFRARAARLNALAPGHPLEAYLRLVARVAEAQAAVEAARGAAGWDLGGEAPADQAVRIEHGMPPLSRHVIETDPTFQDALTALLAALDLAEAPEEARAARAALEAAAPEDRLDLAVQVFEGAIPLERVAECLYVSAALQVCLARRAARLDPRALKPVADGVCPACGGAPTASLIVGWTPADKARYLSCSLCGTLWNHVRIRCTACGSGEGISYYGLDEISKDVQVETCTACHSSIKHLHQHRAVDLDPVADDIASYGLDLKIAEEGFKRAGLNLLFVV
ncbi:formate dehydrogenase accessory protein FdhE [Methylobacterium sp. NEAU 140]|uniref:formate dehydrogenase accessory protein FdhE n=1 Tax=Methylobacterium sp. NEAU 140 TaxID=3064945 RepID=UPI002736CDFF|nr:formate dehydrogenase accessory protein FdhE [Methylobacterium sp. NEAU 140]MDP4024748.1 formate dehydrogenase accessory protein FdhE [Methylobacterium sp. NEAU 140]